MKNTRSRNSHPATTTVLPLHNISKGLPFRVFSDTDWQHWTTKGYIVVRKAVPQSSMEQLVNLLWDFDQTEVPFRYSYNSF